MSTRVSRRTMLLGGAGVLVAAAAGGLELVLHNVLPGHSLLDRVDGACSVPATNPTVLPLGPATEATFRSSYRGRDVGYRIAYPPGHGPGSTLPLIVALHGYGGDHTSPLADLSIQQAVAMQVGGAALPPMAMVAVDGGGGYWHAHPGDDPMGMLVHELIPLCQRLGLGVAPQRIGVVGISMGGYGALLLAQQQPGLVAAVSAISPAIWTTYAQAHTANAGAFDSAADFAANDVIAHAGVLGTTPVRIASGTGDPFHPGVAALVNVLPPGAVVVSTKGCHTASFEASQQPETMAFLASHLVPA